MEQIVTNNSSLSIVTCPVCHRAITVFMDTGPDTEMRCPLCNSTFKFQAVLEGLPPMLQIASESSAPVLVPESDSEEKKFSFDEVPAPPAPKRSSRSKRRKSNSPANSEARRQRSERKRRAAFKRSSPLRETILFVLGGLMALPVGQLIIWWVIGKDPLKFGPPVSRVAAVVVPNKFRDPELKKDKEDDEQDSENTGNGQANQDDSNKNGKLDQKGEQGPLALPKKFQPEEIRKKLQEDGKSKDN